MPARADANDSDAPSAMMAPHRKPQWSRVIRTGVPSAMPFASTERASRTRILVHSLQNCAFMLQWLA